MRYIWILDASFGDVLKIEVPANSPDGFDEVYAEELIEEAFKNEGKGRSLTDCNWMVGTGKVHLLYML
jgi:hypothetical protein